ncbi:MAG: hypothetical protein ACRDHP_20340 [Ktedonobacterales bacterium]
MLEHLYGRVYGRAESCSRPTTLDEEVEAAQKAPLPFLIAASVTLPERWNGPIAGIEGCSRMSEIKAEQRDVDGQEPIGASHAPQKHSRSGQQRTEHWFEIFTAIMLGVVAVATAWSGYQATRWAGEQSTRYAQANVLRVESTRDATLAGEYKLYDVMTVNNWINAYTAGNTALANIYAKRFRLEFQPAFAAWIATDPFHNPNAPPGPLFMPQYKVSLDEQANQLDAQAAQAFDEGQAAKEQGDAYIRITVLLALVLFFTAISESFKWSAVRSTVLIVALGMLLFGLFRVFTYPAI